MAFKTKKMKAPKDKNKPKAPTSGFFRFAAVFRKANPNLGLAEGGKAAGAAWKELGETQKKKYLDEAAAAKAKFQKVKAAYEKSENYAKFQEKLQAFKVKKKKAMKLLVKKQNKANKKSVIG